MSHCQQLGLFAIYWFLIVPLAAAHVADDIVNEQIFKGFLAWIDREYHGTNVAYLFRCPRCISHWLVLLAAVMSFQGWTLIPFPNFLWIMVIVCSTFAAIRLTIAWLPHNPNDIRP